MPKKRALLWYRNYKIVIPTITTILAAILGPTLVYYFNRQVDFNIVINPIVGVVQQGGVIQTSVTIQSVHGYNEDVSLSANMQQSGILVTFSPLFGKAKPWYTSNVLIKTDQDIPPDDYVIVIKGTGADGKEKRSQYTLTVKPVVTQSPPKTLETIISSPTSSLNLKVEIKEPPDGSTVPHSITVQGIATTELPKTEYLWIAVQYSEQIWPQSHYVTPIFLPRNQTYEWYVPVLVGDEKDQGKAFIILALLIPENLDIQFMEWLKRGAKEGQYPPFYFKDIEARGAKVMDVIKVERR